MGPGAPSLDSISVEIRYAFGQTYLDRCGQTMVDIERLGTGWISGDANPNAASMENPGLDASLSFDSMRCAFTANSVANVGVFAAACSELWDIVRANLALTEFLRVGARFHWLVPCTAIDQAESFLRKLELNISIPESLTKANYEVQRRSLVAVLKSGNVEYRASLGATQRVRGTPVSALMTTEPRFLPKNRKAAQIEMLKRRAQYDANPQYGVDLDVDCAIVQPPSVALGEFIARQERVVARDFVPLLRVL